MNKTRFDRAVDAWFAAQQEVTDAAIEQVTRIALGAWPNATHLILEHSDQSTTEGMVVVAVRLDDGTELDWQDIEEALGDPATLDDPLRWLRQSGEGWHHLADPEPQWPDRVRLALVKPEPREGSNDDA